MSGLALTLTFVRVAHGKTVNSVDQMVSTLQFADTRRSYREPPSGSRGKIVSEEVEFEEMV
ncbi:hypothetical protein V5O48_015039 [Marasmius crinis-equi]|uniref:Kinesin motor domain-containing protein n=1 Tax=Marasmius crinis-equi TaxID=585013 RepID=A0ABR3EVN0_9AGAR